MKFDRKLGYYPSEIFETDVLRHTIVNLFFDESIPAEISGECINLAKSLNDHIESMDYDCCFPVFNIMAHKVGDEYSVGFEGLLGVALESPETSFYKRYFWYYFDLAGKRYTDISIVVNQLSSIKNGIIERIKQCESDGDYKINDPIDYFNIITTEISLVLNSDLKLHHFSHQSDVTFNPTVYKDLHGDDYIYLTKNVDRCYAQYKNIHCNKIQEFFSKIMFYESLPVKYNLIPYVIVDKDSRHYSNEEIYNRFKNNPPHESVEMNFINNDDYIVNPELWLDCKLPDNKKITSGLLFVKCE